MNLNQITSIDRTKKKTPLNEWTDQIIVWKLISFELLLMKLIIRVCSECISVKFQWTRTCFAHKNDLISNWGDV